MPVQYGMRLRIALCYAELRLDFRLLACGWLPGFDKQFKSVQLIAKHALDSWRYLLEFPFHESTDAICELQARVVAAACQFQREASSETGTLQRSKPSRKPYNLGRSDVDNA